MRSFLAGLRTLTLPWGASGNQPRIVIGPDIPAELVTWANAQGPPAYTIVACMLWRFSSNQYVWDAVVNNNAGVISRITGTRDSTGLVVEAQSVTALTGSGPLVSFGGAAGTQQLLLFQRMSWSMGFNVSMTFPGMWYRETVEYTANGTFDRDNFTAIYSARACILEGVAGGGGGGFAGSAAAGNASAGGGGGGGGYAWALVTAAQLGSLTWTVTVGAAGAGGTSAVIDGTAGGNMSIVNGGTTLLAASGGQGGESVAGSAGVAVAQGGNPGVGTTGDALVSGSYGMNGVHAANIAIAGEGGPGAVWGASVRGNGTDAGGVGLAAPANSGSGGSGGADQPGGATNRAGGAGAAGRVRIHIFQ